MTGRVLIADDDEFMRDLVRLSLARDGYDLRVVVDGGEAVAAAREHRPDIAILDLSMPVMNGIDVARALKSDPATCDVTVILLTAKSMGAAELAHAPEVDLYLLKPFSPRVLRQVVRDAHGGASDDPGQAGPR